MVEIIPKPAKKIVSIEGISAYISFSLLIAAFFGYFILANFQQKNVKLLDGLEEELLKSITPKERVLENQVLEQKKKIEDFAVLLSLQNKTLGFFETLEGVVHPKVWFNSFTLDTAGMKVSLSGKTESFADLEQQLLAFKNEKKIGEVILKDVKIEKGGNIAFDISLALTKEALK
ncbi:MAG: hypothetical protein HYW70_00380 [Candidatus Nealsonbacteria bacterium]|nr:hypothetical protein [Candidatus Nealsonbacteria bacterium]